MGNSISAAAGKVLRNGVELGYATGISATENIQQVPAAVLGDVDVKEHEAVARTVTVTVDFIKIRKASLVQQGLFPRGGTVEVVNFPEFTIQLFDGVEEITIGSLEGCVPESRTWRMQQGAIMNTNATLRARRLYDEQDS